MSRNTFGYKNQTQYSRHYTDMRGVDFCADGSSIDPRRFSYLENMYRDYEGDGASVTESIPGFRRLYRFPQAIRGIFVQKTHLGTFLLIHAGTELYRFSRDDRDALAALSPIATLADRESAGFAFGEDFFLLDGTRITAVDANGTARRVGESERPPYVPTLFCEGEPHEQKNLLSERVREQYTILSPDALAYGTPGLQYTVLDAAAHTCAVSGYGVAEDTVLRLPSRVRIGSTEHRVVAVADGAFAECDGISEVHMAEGIVEIGERAFFGCSSLYNVVTPNSIASIGTRAFAECSSLDTFFLGASIATIAPGAFEGDNAVTAVTYPLDIAALDAVCGREQLPDSAAIVPNGYNKHGVIEIPVFSAPQEIESVTLDGEPIEYTVRIQGDRIVAVVLETEDKNDLTGRCVLMQAAHPREPQTGTAHAFIGNGRDAVCGCTLAQVFDGRVFLSGNPDHPNTVFFAARRADGGIDPTYFGSYNYFSDGIGYASIRALLSVGDALVVFKATGEAGGSIFYHVPSDTGDDLVPRVYPISYTHAGIGTAGGAISFLDDPVFISSVGLSALEKHTLNSGRSVVCRSHNVNERLLFEDLSRISMTEWRGYLVLCANGRMYLADSRQTFRHASGVTEYEWYFLDGIGSYESDRRVFRYAEPIEPQAALPVTPDTRVSEEVYSEPSPSGTAYYVLRGEARLPVYPTEERTGGVFSPATIVRADAELLFFGTQSGVLCLFNNDLRGRSPARIAEADGYAPSHRIHPDFYSFDGHAPRYAVKTAMDNCGIPHMTKDTVGGSVVVKCRASGAKKLIFEVGTDREGYREITHFPTDEADFSDVDFSAFVLQTDTRFTVPIRERCKRWIEKQICLYCDEFRSPIAIGGIGYRYTVRGNLRRY